MRPVMRWFNRIIPIFQTRKLRHNETLVQGQPEKPAADLGTSSLCSDSLSLHLVTAAATLLPWERVICPTGSLSTNPKQTFWDCQANTHFSLDQEHPPSLPGTGIFSACQMPADPWETRDMDPPSPAPKRNLANVLRDQPWGVPQVGILQRITTKEMLYLFAGDDRTVFLKVIVVSPF